MSDILISHASDDRDRVRPLAETLHREGWDVWGDRELVTGKRYAELIDEQLAAAKGVLVVWTSNSIVSEWVVKEAQDGKERDILFHVLLDNVRAPRGFRLRQGVNLSKVTIDASATAFQKLVAELMTVLGTPSQLSTKSKAAAAPTPQSQTSPLESAGTARQNARDGLEYV